MCVVHSNAMRVSPSKSICHPAATEPTKHAANREYRHSYRSQLFDKFLAHIFAVSIAVHVLHEVFDIFTRRIDDARVVAELQHSQRGRENGVRQEERQALFK